MEWHEILVSILAGLATTIPLVIQLVKYVKQAIKEKNWNKLLSLVMGLMVEAEGKFDNGDERKDWVLMAVKASADTIDYDINMDEVSKLIDSLCAMTKKVNPPKVEEEVAE
jgi:molecular chaperone DnaK (HSP70)